MRRFFLLILLGLFSCDLVLANVTNKDGRVSFNNDLNVNNKLANNPLDKIDLNLIFDQSEEVYKNKKKKKEKAAAIFWGLANAVGSIAQAATGDPKEGMSNFIAGIFNTAAQIAQIEANYTKDPEFVSLKNHLIFNYVMSMAESLYEVIAQDSSKDTNLLRFPLLREYTKIAVYTERAAWIANKILENDFVQKLIEEALDYLQTFLHEKVDDLLEFLREKLLVHNLGELGLKSY